MNFLAESLLYFSKTYQEKLQKNSWKLFFCYSSNVVLGVFDQWGEVDYSHTHMYSLLRELLFDFIYTKTSIYDVLFYAISLYVTFLHSLYLFTSLFYEVHKLRLAIK